MTCPVMLLTGGAGFIGNRFVADAVAEGYVVLVLDKLTYAGRRENLEWIVPHASGGRWALTVGDVADGALVKHLLKEHAVDCVVHMAAESHVDNSITGSAPFVDTNIVGTYRLLEACRDYWKDLPEPKKSAFRFVQVSTDEVYGSLGPEGAFSEASPYAPNSPYSASKAGGDMLARAWFHTYGLPVITTHCTNNYGPRQHLEKLIPRMIYCALQQEKLPVYGDGKNVRDWIHVEDHCRGVMLALTKGKPGEVYDFGGHAETENLALVKKICTLLDEISPRADGQPYATQISFVTDRLGHDRRYAMDDSKAQKELGYQPKHTLEAGLRQAVEWYVQSRIGKQEKVA